MKRPKILAAFKVNVVSALLLGTVASLALGCRSSAYRLSTAEGSEENHTAWIVEGTGTVEADGGALVLREDADGRGMVVWLKRPVSETFDWVFDVSFSNNRCIGVFFFAATGPDGMDVLHPSLSRTGDYEEYLRGHVNTYSVSLHRYWPDGRRNPGSNIRRNPGAHIIASAPDPAIEAGVTYRVNVSKRGAHIRTEVDGVSLHDVTDDGSFGPIWQGGKVGFRLRGDASCSMAVSNVTIR